MRKMRIAKTVIAPKRRKENGCELNGQMEVREPVNYCDPRYIHPRYERPELIKILP
jgi:hypothetical protein